MAPGPRRMRVHLPALLLLYVSLDFANPLMPGAVRFEAGSIEVVQADRTARAARAVPPARPLAMLPTWSGLVRGVGFAQPVRMPPPKPTAALRAIRRLPRQ